MNKATVAAKRWWYIMPIVFITYSLAYLDRANFSFASAAGINDDLGITKGMSSLLGALFFLGYFFFQIPGAIYAERRSVKKLIFWCLILWGGCASLTGVVSNIPMLAAIRFILGVVEAAVMPAMLIYISNWFTKSERSRANTFLILGNPVTVLWMSVVSGYLIHAFGWREMFIIEGIPAVIWAFCWWVLAKDKPAQAKWLNEEEKLALQRQLDEEQKGIKAVRNYGEAFRSRNVILLCAQYFAWSIGVYGFVLWLPSILRSGMQMGMVEAGWLSAVPYLAATIAMIVVSWASDKMQNRKLFVWPLLLIGALAFFGSYAVGANHFWVSYGLLVIAGAAMYAPYGPFFAIIPEMLPKNVAGGAMALINSMGALGSFFGSWFVGYLNGATGSPAASYMFMAIALVAAVVLTLIVKPARNEVQPQLA
ncbi:Inner membrane transport protein RhmT [Serratia entomophila]|jgi:sugar phosphate permease|uniref:MFS transporter n=1 Tax=Serratia entomophila TaxID=42906 RepID=UPI002177ACE9|nr:MFS transporter [Serratia entomophila]CAI0974819.1 Inner membrane transport protein RhmT [Serratia entomophila]CAI1875532.1 Inner membrane transport protein RhmT [Serratia entomophila]CAI1909615.1 Inner membrane transport protein RhmT [Serratia entomophila]CAI1962601.1 Inner membrane transport protein RhmT [Serratia entomophila]CAI2079728.1 Inner membrane transport protein RhmT [Serratia entomophila]